LYNNSKQNVNMWNLKATTLCLWLLANGSSAFQPSVVGSSSSCHHRRPNTIALKYAAADASLDDLKVRDIQAELRDLGVDYYDCFDREAMVCRLRDARAGDVAPTTPKAKATTVEKPKTLPDATEILADLRSKSVKDLKLECSRRNLRYATFLEKEDFVQAAWKDMQETCGFSVSGALRPGQATDVTGEQLDQEMTSSDTPILVDVYATWCGPCKMMAPELDKLAAELGKQLRVVKIDSDQHPAWAGRYAIRGLPTTLLMYKGEVVKRVEGAVMKDKLLEMVQPHLLSGQ
jgi:thioredoxin 1